MNFKIIGIYISIMMAALAAPINVHSSYSFSKYKQRISRAFTASFNWFNRTRFNSSRANKVNSNKFPALLTTAAALNYSIYQTAHNKEQVSHNPTNTNQSVSTTYSFAPRQKPIGIKNTIGTCYASTVIQFLEAAFAARPESMAKLMQHADTGLIQAFSHTRQDFFKEPKASTFPDRVKQTINNLWKVCCARTSKTEKLIDPSRISTIWFRKNLHGDYGTYVQKQRKNNDGTITITELFPKQAALPIGGHPGIMIWEIMRESRNIAKKQGFTQPFTEYLGLQPKSLIERITQYFSKTTATIALDINPFKGHIINNPSEFLVFYNHDLQQFTPALDIDVYVTQDLDLATERIITKPFHYRLVSVLQRKFIFRHTPCCNRFITAGHVICYTRYNEQWFKCNDETITPMLAESMRTELEEDARITYDGFALTDRNLKFSDQPMVLLYERVD